MSNQCPGSGQTPTDVVTYRTASEIRVTALAEGQDASRCAMLCPNPGCGSARNAKRDGTFPAHRVAKRPAVVRL